MHAMHAQQVTMTGPRLPHIKPPKRPLRPCSKSSIRMHGDAQRLDRALIDRAKQLDKHYIPTRYPNGFERGAPTDLYTLQEADEAIANAEAIIEFCRGQIG